MLYNVIWIEKEQREVNLVNAEKKKKGKSNVEDEYKKNKVNRPKSRALS